MHFDAIPVPTATIDDLDLRRFEEEYLPLAVDAATLRQNDRSVEQRLAAMKMVGSADSPTPAIAGLIVLGKNPRDFLPGAYVQFLRIAGSGLSDPVADATLCDGPLMGLIDRLDAKLDAHNRVAVDFTSGPRELRTWTYARGALQQLTLNAVMHRTYEGTNSPVHVYWFDDRIEINSLAKDHAIATVRHYRSLVPLAQEARKPIFALAPADGAIGSHATAARDAFGDFEALANEIVRRVEAARGRPLPVP